MENPEKNLQNQNPNSPDDPSRNQNPWGKYARYSAAGIQMGAVILLGLWAGIKLDSYFNVSPQVFTPVLTFLSFGGAMYYFFSVVLKK